MEKNTKSSKKIKSIDALLGIITENEILNINQLKYIKGGDADPTMPVLPPINPKV